MGRFTDFLCGHVLLGVRGARPEVFLNALLAAGVPFGGARRSAEGLRLRLRVAEFRRIRAAARAARVRVHILRRGGLPFALARARRRPALLVAAGAGAVLLYVLSGFIWFVQVQGADRVATAEIVRAAAALGLRPGAYRAGLDAAEIARRLPAAVPDLSWAGVSFRGTLALVRVVERVRPSPLYEQANVPGDVVAAHAGIVRSVSATAGTPEVAPGDRVHAGQVLIRGMVAMPIARTRQSGLEGVRNVAVHAAGTVIAVQTHHAYAEAPRATVAGLATGRVFVRRTVLVGGRGLVVQGWGRVPFSHYQLSKYSTGPLRWRNVALPIEVVTARYVEVRPHHELLTVDAAAQVAAAEALTFILGQLPQRARILTQGRQTTVLPGGRVAVELRVESEDNIGVFRPAGPAPSGASDAQGAS